ncbi:EAL domain-containing protein [Acidovorax sp. FG27]|uniref:EAL domain-containing protein n=1 Tax=Acidovorax sp. FG27 TaxID=3133652 RepID=UPI003340C659
MSSSSALRLRSAIERCQVYPVFQPIVRIESGAVAGFEVLARWDDAEQGSISPAVFIPLAQNAGLLQKLTGQLLERACREAASWCSAVTLSVNIAPELLQDGGLARMVLDTARATGFTPSRLCIEITEQALEPVWLPHARTTLELLKQHGVKLALDDFGTGHSSLSRLQELPFDSLKIDMSFVQSMLQRRESRKIVAAVIGLGQSLGLSVVAEGVQTPAQLALLRELGCCLGQGFHYGAGLTAIQAAAAISSRRVVQAIHSGRPLDRSPNQRLAQLQSIYDSSLVAIAFIDQDRRVVGWRRDSATGNMVAGPVLHGVLPRSERRSEGNHGRIPGHGGHHGKKIGRARFAHQRRALSQHRGAESPMQLGGRAERAFSVYQPQIPGSRRQVAA